MTSSLVGSEMCIRDRPLPRRRVLEAHLRTALATARSPWPLNRPQQLLPVSYTHLTLPTICSV
eukprot:2909368-Prorocentrum_lima.AAC.1